MYMKNILCCFIFFICYACDGDTASMNNKATTLTQTPAVSSERANPNPQPVAVFSEKVTSETGRLNNWKFAVSLYETARTFTYRIQIQYAEAVITDSFQFPNLGIAPKPILQKGKDEYSCIVSFMDNQNVFREYKSVTVVDGNIRIHTLKYYSVSRTATVQ